MITQTGAWQGEIWNRRSNGEIYPEWLSVSVLKGARGNVTHYVGIFSDISERKAAEEQIRHMAQHDPLTKRPGDAIAASLDQSSVAVDLKRG